jgi:hypothetical protein
MAEFKCKTTPPDPDKSAWPSDLVPKQIQPSAAGDVIWFNFSAGPTKDRCFKYALHPDQDSGNGAIVTDITIDPQIINHPK